MRFRSHAVSETRNLKLLKLLAKPATPPSALTAWHVWRANAPDVQEIGRPVIRAVRRRQISKNYWLRLRSIHSHLRHPQHRRCSVNTQWHARKRWRISKRTGRCGCPLYPPKAGQRRLVQPTHSVTLSVPAQVVAVRHVGHPFVKRRRTFFVRRNANRVGNHNLCHRST